MLSTIFQAVSIIFTIAAIFTGIQALLQPTRFAKSFGIPIPSTSVNTQRERGFSKRSQDEKPSTAFKSEQDHQSHVAASYVSLMGVRQLATGVILLTFSVQHKWTEAAQILAIIGFLVAGTDGVFLSKTGRMDLALFHALPGAGIAVLACVALYMGETA